ncbi:MAG: MoxR family ATPase [Eubacteriales bacterium]|nr:MoxR family ATPase [Eubacteriales bacterium]
MEEVKTLADKLRNNVSKVILGADDTVDFILTAILAGGHVLIEDQPGTGKTMLAKAFAKSMNGDFKRVQFTPDLLPSDITGLSIYNQKSQEFVLSKGPVFTNVLLADEINRATPRTQSALLEAMEERQVTIDGDTMKLAVPFLVIATENPLETIGTYPLPEAQLDRFLMKLDMGKSTKQHELDVIERYIGESPLESLEAVCDMNELVAAQGKISQIFVHQAVREYIVNIVFALRENSRIQTGVSTRGILAMVRSAQAYAAMSGRNYVEPDDVKKLAPRIFGHRIITLGNSNYKKNYELVNEVVDTVKVPVENWEN